MIADITPTECGARLHVLTNYYVLYCFTVFICHFGSNIRWCIPMARAVNLERTTFLCNSDVSKQNQVW